MIKTVQDDRPLQVSYAISNLPLAGEIESRAILKKLPTVERALAELKGIAQIVPNNDILISTLPLQEAKDSSEIENILTTNDELFRAAVGGSAISPATKEVSSYAQALRDGYRAVSKQHLLTNNMILAIQKQIKKNDVGFRTQAGTKIKNDNTGETIHVPLQESAEIIRLMGNLEKFINDDDLCDWHPLVKMAVIHHQFESIHPFFDGNGRTGRIINILYLVQQGLLDTPILYLSRYINQHKATYYHLLQTVQSEQTWEEWILFMLDGVEKTSQHTVKLVRNIRQLMQEHKNTLRSKKPKIYSQDLINIIFSYPYIKIPFVENELDISRITAVKYLNALVDIQILTKYKIGRENYYINNSLTRLLISVGENTIEDSIKT